MHVNGEQLFYQTNFVVLPNNSLAGPMSRVVGTICDWVEQVASPDLATAVRGARGERLPNVAFPADYPGGAVDDEGVGQCLRTTYWKDRCQWALDFDKPDDKEPLMRWHTSIGVDDLDGMCRVNIRVVVYMMSGFCCLFDPVREINVPKVVKMLWELDGVRCFCGGGFPLTEEKIPVLEGTWEHDFMSILVSHNRKIPLVLVCSSMDGVMPYDPTTLAREFMGVALVFSLDFSEPWVLRKLHGSFPKDTRAATWAPRENEICVYQPGVDLGKDSSRRKKVYYTGKTIGRYGHRGDFSRILRNALLRHGRPDGEVYGTKDLDKGRQVEMQEREFTKLEGEVEQAQRDADFYLKMAESYSSEDQKLKSDVGGGDIVGKVSVVERQLAEAEASSKHHQTRCDALESKLSETAREVNNLKEALATYEGMTHVPTKLSELLGVFEKVYADKVEVIEAARRSAKEFDGKVPLDESLAILRSIGTVLWDLYFRQDGRTNIAEVFLNKTGFVLALHESDGTMSSKKARAERTVRYKGRSITAVKHIKGRSSSQSNAFRVYFEVDQDERKIVITHCGKHLWTVGSQRRSIR